MCNAGFAMLYHASAKNVKRMNVPKIIPLCGIVHDPGRRPRLFLREKSGFS